MINFIKKIIGTKNERVIKRLLPMVDEINSIYEKLHNLKDEDLLKKTEDFKLRYFQGESLNEILPEAYALVKESCRRLVGKKWIVRGYETEWNMIPFDVQILGGIILHQGKIAEMKTGEGKTLVATMPLYLNALTGKGVHLVTVNDYLAIRDKEWMGPVYENLGMTIGVLQNGMTPEERKPQYNSDILYGTNNEFGFDYLRDNMVIRWEDKVQREHYYAIIDEVDSILIDEARTPLIISGPVSKDTNKIYYQFAPAVSKLAYQQMLLVNRLVDKGSQLLKEGKEKEAGINFLKAKKGLPKHKKLMKAMQEPSVYRLIEETELSFMRAKKIKEIEEDLYFVIDEKAHVVDLTEKGRKFLSPDKPDQFLLPDLSIEIAEIDKKRTLSPQEKIKEKEKAYEKYAKRNEELHTISALLKAYALFDKDVDYVVMHNKVIIVDEFTGRLMPGRRFSDGLHEALEAKEKVKVQQETQTFATITLQNYFRMYEKLAGMTGTAATEGYEFWNIYKLDVVVIPTNEPIRRIDYTDIVFKTKKEKYTAIINEVEKWHNRGRPILIGTTSVDVSEVLSRMLKRKGIPHSVLNAKYHQKEAEIVSKAGQSYAVTIATNMAGRGTDIKLARDVVKCKPKCYINNDAEYIDLEVAKKCKKEIPCGLYIIGTEKHESRRIDNQLRGRSGRQGDPGSSKFFLSLEDNLMRLFGSDRMATMMERFGKKEMEPMQHPLVTKAIEDAQKRVERRNFEIRKRLLEFDDVMNQQREVVYEIRDEILKGENLKDVYMEWTDLVVNNILDKYTDTKYSESWNWDGIIGEFGLIFFTDVKIEDREEINREQLKDLLMKIAEDRYEKRKEEIGEHFYEMVKFVFLSSIDARWRDHLYSLDQVKEGIYLRGYAQKDPLVEYKRESYNLFEEMYADLARTACGYIYRTTVTPKPKVPEKVIETKPSVTGKIQTDKKAKLITKNPKKKIGRNDPCPCGSGKKYKHCCGKNA